MWVWVDKGGVGEMREEKGRERGDERMEDGRRASYPCYGDPTLTQCQIY